MVACTCLWVMGDYGGNTRLGMEDASHRTYGLAFTGTGCRCRANVLWWLLHQCQRQNSMNHNECLSRPTLVWDTLHAGNSAGTRHTLLEVSCSSCWLHRTVNTGFTDPADSPCHLPPQHRPVYSLKTLVPVIPRSFLAGIDLVAKDWSMGCEIQWVGFFLGSFCCEGEEHNRFVWPFSS